MEIKKSRFEDAGVISLIHALSWKEAYKGLVPQKYLDELKSDFWTKAFKEWLATGAVEVFTAYDGDKAVGCVSFSKSRDKSMEDYGEIISFYVLPEYFRQGIGGALLKSALESLKEKGYKKRFLWVLEGNAQGIGFYKKHGFKQTSDRHIEKLMGKELINIRFVRF